MRRVDPSSSVSDKLLPPGKPMIGILLILASVFLLSALDASGKWVMAAGVPLFVFCWFRYLSHFLLLSCVAIPSRGWSILHSQSPRLQILRACAMLSATLSFFTTLSYLHQAEATAIIFISPLLMLSVAPWLLNEAPQRSRWIAAGIGLIGILIVVRPDSGLHPLGVAAGLLTACLFATQHLATRLVARDDALTTGLWSSGLGVLSLGLLMPVLMPLAWPQLQAMPLAYWLVMLSTGISGGMGHLLQTMAYRQAPASVLAPFIYLQMLSAVTMGWLIWGHFPDGVTWIGIAIICSSGVANSVVEWRRTLKNAALAPA
jgi:drug/metabolite transporter (DMT)-like permease